jgi:hypothetical protein
MKTKLTLSIESSLMEEIKKKTRLDKRINLSKMIEQFLFNEFHSSGDKKKENTVSQLRGILKGANVEEWKDEKTDRLTKKYL